MIKKETFKEVLPLLSNSNFTEVAESIVNSSLTDSQRIKLLRLKAHRKWENYQLNNIKKQIHKYIDWYLEFYSSEDEMFEGDYLRVKISINGDSKDFYVEPIFHVEDSKTKRPKFLLN